MDDWKGAIPWGRVAVGASLLWLLACVGTVEGERAATGECPEGEVCSDEAPNGLVFVGEVFYDSAGVAQLGPIGEGGRFDLGLRTPDGTPLEGWDYEIDQPGVLGGDVGTGEFLGDGSPVDGYLSLRAVEPGRAYVRIVDPETGELYDRLSFDVYAFDRAEIVNAHFPERGYAYAGCNEALGVHLIGVNGDGGEVRLFDQDLDITGDFMSQPDPGYWDCFLVDIPTDVGAVKFDAHRGNGEVVPLEMPVRTLAEDGLSACPGAD